MLELNDVLLKSVRRNASEVFSLSNRLTDRPEVSGEEKESSRAVVEFLKQRGYEIEEPYGGIDYSFRAFLPTADPSLPRVAIMVEYDALPEVGHACGHSLSAGISILTALALREAAPDLPLTFELVGTPAEESIGGKAIMAKNGAFDRYCLAIMNHLDNYNAPQARVLASNDMYITFTGKAAHASGNPEDGINAFNAAQLFAHASDMLRQHIKPDLQFHGIITRGGEAPNIVPERVELDYYLRSPTITGLDDLRSKLERCAEGAAIATGCQYETKQRWETYSDLFYSVAAEGAIIEIYKALDLPWRIYDKPEGSGDVGNVDMVTPTLALYTKCTDTFIPFHSKEIVPLLYGERGLKTLLDGTDVMASFLFQCGTEPELLPAVRKEWEEYRNIR
jgi:amidohydrolase